MSDTERLSALRIGRLESNLDVRPIDLLRAAAFDVESGATKCDGVIVLLVHRPEGVSWGLSTMRAGLAWNDELTALQLELFRHTLRQFERVVP